MAEEHVTAVFGPPWVRESLAFYKQRCKDQEKVVLSLRRLLKKYNPRLPNVYDGEAWHNIEKRW